MCDVMEFVVINDVVGKVRMSVVMNLAFRVEMTLLRCILTVIMSAVGVPQSPGKLMRLPPTVRPMRYGSSFLG